MATEWSTLLSEARSEKRRSERIESSYVSSKKTAQSDLSDSKKEKLNLEKRLKGIEKIIKLLTVSGGIFSNNVPDKTEKARKESTKTGEAYSGCIKCPEISAADVAEKFKTASVEENSNSKRALEEIRKEKQRVEEAIEEINRQIKKLEQKIEDCIAKINKCNREQAHWDRIIRQCKANMD